MTVAADFEHLRAHLHADRWSARVEVDQCTFICTLLHRSCSSGCGRTVAVCAGQLISRPPPHRSAKGGVERRASVRRSGRPQSSAVSRPLRRRAAIVTAVASTPRTNRPSTTTSSPSPRLPPRPWVGMPAPYHRRLSASPVDRRRLLHSVCLYTSNPSSCTRMSATSCTPRSAGAHQDTIKKGFDAIDGHTCGGWVEAGPVRPVGCALPGRSTRSTSAGLRGRHPGQLAIRQGRRRLHHEGRARLRPPPAAADRVLQSIQAITEDSGTEISPADVGRVPADYLPRIAA